MKKINTSVAIHLIASTAHFLKRIQHHRVSINGAAPLSGVSSMTAEHNEMLKALRVKTPSQNQQLRLL